MARHVLLCRLIERTFINVNGIFPGEVMNKNIIAAAVAAALATPLAFAPLIANADDDDTAIMYGQLRVATQSANRDNLGPNSAGLQDQSSRLGVKGSEGLGDGLKAIYQMEFGVNVGSGYDGSGNGTPITGTASGCSGTVTAGHLSKGTCTTVSGTANSFWTMRDSYVGLASQFGTVLMGRHDTPMKMSTAKLDFFRDSVAGSNSNNGEPAPGGTGMLSTNGTGLFDNLRVSGVVAYVSPDFNGFSLVGAAVQHNAADITGDSPAFAGAYSVAGMYSNGPWFGTLSYESIDVSNLNPGAYTGAGDPVYNKWRVGVGMLDFNNFSASFVYENRSNDIMVGGFDSSSWQLQAAYDFPGDLRLKAMYGQFLINDGWHTAAGVHVHDTNALLYSTAGLGLEYDLSKRTDFQLLYRYKRFSGTTANLVGLVPENPGTLDDNVVALQLDHSF